jgi:hypothetical protein
LRLSGLRQNACILTGFALFPTCEAQKPDNPTTVSYGCSFATHHLHTALAAQIAKSASCETRMRRFPACCNDCQT